ncbi:MAG: glycogen-binding domain-containing protein [Bacteroidia bacterium]
MANLKNIFYKSLIAVIVLFTVTSVKCFAQNKCMLKNGGMHIVINRHQTVASLDSFLTRYNLTDLDVKDYYRPTMTDSLKAKGWTILSLTQDEITISKTLNALEGFKDPQNTILISNKNNSPIDFPKLSEETVFGYNRFVSKPDYAVRNSEVAFFLRGHTNAKRVLISGTFNNWSTSSGIMIKRDNGWVLNIPLNPGKYWYKFIVDDNWIYDEDNQNKEPNEFEDYNSVYYCCNYTFKLNDYANAKRVYLTGSFVDWDKNKLRMIKTDKGWEFPVYLTNGTYTYKFLVDGKWVADPLNPNKVSDENGGYNSVLTRGTFYTFKLKGYPNAKQVVLSGTFNNWKEGELLMKKSDDGWQLPYVMRPGNYEYKFIVDGNWITDPSNNKITKNDQQTFNSIIVIKPNYTFHLKGHKEAKNVTVAGDFNTWNDYGYPMSFINNEWVLPVYLSSGKHTYKFIVDGNWILDPGNKLWENNEYGTGNSVIWIDKK